MGGGLMQLVAYGAQDIYLTGNPQVTYFKVVYRRHTNFSMESIAQTFNGKADFGKKVSCTISRNGDLVTRMYVEIELESYDETVPLIDVLYNRSHSYINNVEIEIGGQLIDKHYGEWLHIWASLSECYDKKIQLRKLVNIRGDGNSARVYIPLQFWFCRNPGLALPLIALQYHEVKINIEFQKLEKLANNIDTITDHGSNFAKMNNACLFCDYIYLDTDERRRFAQVSHEYLIEQVQFSGCNSVGISGAAKQLVNLPLNFNHPVKEMIWVVQSEYAAEGNGTLLGPPTLTPVNNSNFIFNFTNRNKEDHVDTALLQLNGHDRFKKRSGSYFENVQRYQHHSGSITGNTLSLLKNIANERGIYSYSFALNPEEHQPSGSCNFSRIDNAVLCLELKPSRPFLGPIIDPVSRQVRIYAINYNVLRIMSGMAGLAYSN